MADFRSRLPRARIGLLPTGHFYYWDQFPRLKEMGMRMFDRLRGHLEEIGDIVAPELVDTKERALQANEYFRREQPDILLVFPFGYTPGMCVLPAIEGIDVPLRLMNSHEDGSYDYQNADTTVYLHHEGPCCIPRVFRRTRQSGPKIQGTYRPVHLRSIMERGESRLRGCRGGPLLPLHERRSDRGNVYEHGGHAVR